MADSVEIDEITRIHSFLGHAILNAMGDCKDDLVAKFHLNGEPVQVSLIINGVEVPVRPFFEELERQYTDIVKRGVAEKLMQDFRERFDALDALLQGAERKLRDELRDKGFLYEDD